MKKRIRVLLAAAAALVVMGAGATALAGSDSLISLSYLTQTFQPSAQKQADAVGEGAVQKAYDQAVKDLDALVQGSDGDSRPYSGDLRSRSYTRGDVLTIQAGAGLMVFSGDLSVTHDGALVDVTEGKEAPSGSHLTAGHRYLAAENTTVKVTVRSGLAKLGIEGYYTQKLSGQSAAPYVDISDGDAWAKAVDYAYEKNLLTGTGDDKFSPAMSMSRAMMTTVFYRLAGSPESQMNGAKASFNDVKDGQWFTPYVRWAAEQGVTSGTNVNPPMFSPDMQVTRQQVAVMLYGFAQKSLGLKLEGTADLTRYTDGGQVAFWAQQQVAWAVENGILSPINGRLEPESNAARGDVAMMLMAFSEKYL